MKRSILILCILLIIGGYLRFYGADWGIPKPPYWRNHFQDEAFVLATLLRMGPDNLNPHYFINPSLPFYTVFAALEVSPLLGYIKPFDLPVKTNRLGYPVEGVSLEDYARMYRIARLVTIVQGILVILLVFMIGRNLYNKRIGLIAAAFTAILPTLAYQSHFFVVDAPALFWLILAFYFLTTPISKNRLRWFVLAGVFTGLALGAKYLNILLILPLFYRIFTENVAGTNNPLKRVFNRYSLIALVVMAVVFILTTPYSVLARHEFLYGDAQEFGGIFGRRGLTWALWSTNFLTPFSLSTFHSLRLPLTIVALVGVVYLFLKRRRSDILLLFYTVPFYLLLIYHASPHLRHILPVLPFLMIATARMVNDLLETKKNRFIKPLVIVTTAAVFGYTLLFSFSYIYRMTPVDTRIACAEWMKENCGKDATIGIPSYFPWNYTPPVEMSFEKIVVTGFDYSKLMDLKPDYLIITEHEYREFPYARESRYVCQRFVKNLFSGRDYKIIKEFKVDFTILGIKFEPNFPNMDWNQVNPRICIMSRTPGAKGVDQ